MLARQPQHTRRRTAARRLLAVPVALVASLPWTARALASEPPEAPTTEPCPSGLVGIPHRGPELCGTLNPHSDARLSSAYFVFNAGAHCEDQHMASLEQMTGDGLEGEALKVSADLGGGLAPGTEYAYCLVAENELGSVFSPSATFTTTAAPVTEAATSVTSESAILHGTLAPNGTADLRYDFAFAQGGSCFGAETTPEVAGEGSVSATVGKLAAHTEYTFCLVAIGGEDGTAAGAPMHFTTAETQAETETRERLADEGHKEPDEAELLAQAQSAVEALLSGHGLGEVTIVSGNQQAPSSATQSQSAARSHEDPLTLRIRSVSIGTHGLIVTLQSSGRGSIKLSGLGLRTTFAKARPGVARVKVSLTAAGMGARRHHRRLTIVARLSAGTKVATGSLSITL